ncbi:MAG TPA: diguanylate cyclase [Thermoanaerobaculia bacterium]|nr:diguanylate cyclase [Thermoanaerobaculia bacterium]
MAENPKRPAASLAEVPRPRPARPAAATLPEDALLLRFLLTTAEAPGFPEALHGILRDVCRATGWTLGQAWVPEEGENQLRLAATYHPADRRFADFCTASAALPPKPLPGIMASGFPDGEPAWDADLVSRSEFLRAQAANEARLRCGVAYPLRAGTGLLAVLEFFSSETREEDAPIADRLAGILPRAAPALANRRSEAGHRSRAEELEQRLGERTQEMGRRTEAVALLNGMTGMLQSARSITDILEILRQVSPRLFSGTRGGLYVLDAAHRTLESVVAWESLSETSFHVDDCWALRLSQTHVVRLPVGGPLCAHVRGTPEGKSLCFPLLAHGEAHGLLHLSGADADERFALNVASQVALAMANVKLRESLQIQSVRDPLTGLYNRRHLEQALERELRRAAREKAPVGILMADIDFFKRVNDTAGHAAGDEVLRELGRFFTVHLRPYDVACRFGGEEFTLILPGSTLESAARHAERLRESVRELTPAFEGRPLGPISLSLGVAAFPEDGDTPEALLAAADAALYRAKAAGRNRVVAGRPAAG